VLLEQVAQDLFLGRCLLQEALVDDVADVGHVQVDAQAGWEPVLQLPMLLASELSSSFCWPVASSQTRPFRRWPSWTRSFAGQHALLVLVDVLTDLVDDKEDPLFGCAPIQHGSDGLDDLLDRGSAAVGCAAGVRIHPAHGIAIEVGIQQMHGVGEVFLDQGVVFHLFPRALGRLCGGGEEGIPLAVQFETQLAVRDIGAAAAVSQARLQLAEGR